MSGSARRPTAERNSRSIKIVQRHIDECLRRYMSKSECIHELQLHHNIDQKLAEIVWDLNELNSGEFFKQYNIRLVLRESINTLNPLIDEQVRRKDLFGVQALNGNMLIGGFSVNDFIREINRTQDLIKDCIWRYMTKSQCKQDLHLHHNIDPQLTEIIWNKLEEQNKEFFEQYYIRLVLIDQMNTFNTLLEKQARWTEALVNTNDQSPATSLNGHQAPPSAPVNTSDQSPVALNSETGSGSVDGDKTLPNSK